MMIDFNLIFSLYNEILSRCNEMPRRLKEKICRNAEIRSRFNEILIRFNKRLCRTFEIPSCNNEILSRNNDIHVVERSIY